MQFYLINTLFILNSAEINNNSSWLIFINTISQLFFLTVLLIIILSIIKYFKVDKNIFKNKQKEIQIIERKYLNNNSQLVSIVFNKEKILLGVSKDNIRMLSKKPLEDSEIKQSND